MKTNLKKKLTLALSMIGLVVIANAPSVSDAEATSYTIMNTPYNQVLGVTEVGLDRLVDVESTTHDVLLTVEWDPTVGDYVIREWDEVPVTANPN